MGRFLSIVFVLLLLGGGGVAFFLYQDQILAYCDSYLINREAQQHLNRGQTDAAIEAFETGAVKYPDHVPFRYNLAILRQQKNEPDKARVLFKKVLQDDPEHVEARLGYATTLFQLGRYNDAIIQYRQLLAHDSTDTRILNNLGQLYLHLGGHPKVTQAKYRENFNRWAIYYFLHSLRQAPKQRDTRFGLGILYQRFNNTEKAMIQYCQALLLDTNRYESRYNLGLILVDAKHYDEGFRQLRHAVHMLEEQNRVDEARRLAEVVQGVKNSIQMDTSAEVGFPRSATPLPEGVDSACLLNNPVDTAQ